MITFAYYILTIKSSYLYNESGGEKGRGEVKSKIKYTTNKVIKNKINEGELK